MEKETIEKIICKTGIDLAKIKIVICRIFDNLEGYKFDKELKKIIDEFKKEIDEIRSEN